MISYIKALIVSLLALTLFASAGNASTAKETRKFLREYRHSWCPYAFPLETNNNELQQVIDLGFDTIGVNFSGPYNNGSIDFSTLDSAIKLISDKGRHAVIHLLPRFCEVDGVSDRLSSGRTVISQWNDGDRFSIIDVFDVNQRAKFNDYVRRCALKYGSDPRVVAFVIGWGYQGETGFFTGNWMTENKPGGECAGYSDCALREFNSWRSKLSLPSVKTLPMPSSTRQSDEYVSFHRFRCEFLRDVFQRQIIAAAQAGTTKPVGMFTYISAYPVNYARNWTDAPGADFYRTAGSASSYNMSRTLIDSGIGWEDSGIHDGGWDYTAACMQRDEARQIARGGVFHMMWVKSYEQEKQWERGLVEKLSSFLLSQRIEESIHHATPTVALFQPTWAVASIPSRDDVQKFVPGDDYCAYLTKMVGIVESFGLPYRIVTERDLLDPASLKTYKHIIVPMWDNMPQVLGEKAFKKLSADKRVLRIPLTKRQLTRSEFRNMLKTSGIKMLLDFDSDKILAGRINNLVYNWSSKPIKFWVPDTNQNGELAGHQYKLL